MRSIALPLCGLVLLVLLAAPRAEAKAPTQQEIERQKVISAAMLLLLERMHLRGRAPDDEVSKKAFKSLIDGLDPTKIFLLQEDVDALGKHRLKLDDQLKAGTLEVAIEGSAILGRRTAWAAKTVASLLAKPFDLKRKETYQTDSDKRTWAKRQSALRERWRKSLKLGVLHRLTDMADTDKAKAKAARKEGKPVPPLRSLVQREKDARAALAKRYSGRFKRLETVEHIQGVERFMNATLDAFDPHSQYMPPARQKNFMIRMSGKLEGIGAVLTESDTYIKVVRIVPGSASWREGRLQAGDLIMTVTQDKEVDGVDLAGMKLDEVVQLIRGKKGTVVTLTVRKSDDRIQRIRIKRDVVEITATFAKGGIIKRKGFGAPIGYIEVPSFYGGLGKGKGRNSSEDTKKLVLALARDGAKAIVLDLRGNGGGLLSAAEHMAGLFIESGPVVQLRMKTGERHVLRDRDPTLVFDGPLIVMVDRFSASASEIVAGALQDYGRAVIVGTSQTHGKGTMQVIHSLDELIGNDPNMKPLGPFGALKLTKGEFFRITGESNQLRGTKPDILLPDPAAHIESGERYYKNALAGSRADKLAFTPWKHTWKIPALAGKSARRQRNVAAFALARKRAELFAKLRKSTVEPLALDAWRARRAKREKAIEALDEPEDSPALFAIAPVLYGPVSSAPEPQARVADRKKWADRVARDAYLNEALNVLGDMGLK